MPAGRPRIGLIALSTECNSFAPELTLRDFESLCLLRGEEMTSAFARGGGSLPSEMKGFMAASPGEVELVPIFAAVSESGGPIGEAMFDAFRAEIVVGLRAAQPLAGVYAALHGALITPLRADAEGELLAAVREACGEGVPIVATLDLHGKVTPRMLRLASLIAYRTNPHVDQAECGRAAARQMARELAGQAPIACAAHVPMIATESLTLSGAFARLMRDATRQME